MAAAVTRNKLHLIPLCITAFRIVHAAHVICHFIPFVTNAEK
jgi:hypothetical protein